mmetsp:Transcript_24354/g.45371  ORF Transcript_24354/g.45371 Transcript_24354/m.45371 type:complete len:473 (+) Transcript_24354:87-1505(+)
MNSSSPSSVVKDIMEKTVQGDLDGVLQAVFALFRVRPPPFDSYFLAFVRCLFVKDSKRFKPPLYYAAKSGHLHLVKFYLELLVIARSTAYPNYQVIPPRTVQDHLLFSSSFPCWFDEDEFLECVHVAKNDEIWECMWTNEIALSQAISRCVDTVGIFTLVGDSLRRYVHSVEGRPVQPRKNDKWSTGVTKPSLMLAAIPETQPKKEKTTKKENRTRKHKPLVSPSPEELPILVRDHHSRRGTPRGGKKFVQIQTEILDWAEKFQTKTFHTIYMNYDGLGNDAYFMDTPYVDRDDVDNIHDNDNDVDKEGNVVDVVDDNNVDVDKEGNSTTKKSIPISSLIATEQSQRSNRSLDADGWEFLSEDDVSDDDVISLESFNNDMSVLGFSYKDALTKGSAAVLAVRDQEKENKAIPIQNSTNLSVAVHAFRRCPYQENMFDADFIRNGVKELRGERASFLKQKQKHKTKREVATSR